MKRSSWSVILSATCVMLLWGSLFPAVKLGYRMLAIDTSNVANLFLFAGVRFLLCGILLTVFCILKKENLEIEGKRDIRRLVIVSLFAVVLHYACTYTGLSMVESGKTALLKQLGALLFICFSFVFFKEDKFSIYKLAAAGLGLIGIVILHLDGSSWQLSFGIGEILIVAASLCTVISNVSGKKLTRTLSPVVMTGYTQLAGGLFLTVIGLAGGGSFGTLSLEGIGVFLYILVASCISYGMWYSLIQKNNLSHLFIIKFLEPVFAAVFGVWLLGEAFSITYLIALLFTVTAIAVSQMKKKKA